MVVELFYKVNTRNRWSIWTVNLVTSVLIRCRTSSHCFTLQYWVDGMYTWVRNRTVRKLFSRLISIYWSKQFRSHVSTERIIKCTLKIQTFSRVANNNLKSIKNETQSLEFQPNSLILNQNSFKVRYPTGNEPSLELRLILKDVLNLLSSSSDTISSSIDSSILELFW